MNGLFEANVFRAESELAPNEFPIGLRAEIEPFGI